MAGIIVISGGATKAAFAILVPQFEKMAGHAVNVSHLVTGEIDKKIAAGEPMDVLVQPVGVLDRMQKDGAAKAQGRAVLGVVGLSVIVPTGAAKPDLSSADTFVHAMRAARAVVHSTPGVTPSGTHLGKMMECLGLAAEMAKKTTYRPALEGGVETVGRGDADIGIYPASEVIGVPGIDVAGRVPGDLDLNVTVGAALTTRCAEPDASAALIAFLSGKESHDGWIAGGFAPVA